MASEGQSKLEGVVPGSSSPLLVAGKRPLRMILSELVLARASTVFQNCSLRSCCLASLVGQHNPHPGLQLAAQLEFADALVEQRGIHVHEDLERVVDEAVDGPRALAEKTSPRTDSSAS